MKRPSRRAVALGAGVGTALLFGLGAGGINVFVGQTTIPGGTPPAGSANLWVVPSGAGSCTRSSSPTTFVSGTSCTIAGALSASQAGDLVLVRDGTYTGLSGVTTSKTSPGVTFKAETPGGASTADITISTGDWLTFENWTVTSGGAGCGPAGGCTNITFKNSNITGESSVYGNGATANGPVTWIGNSISGRNLNAGGSNDNDTMRIWGSATGISVIDNKINAQDHLAGTTGHTDTFQACAICNGGSRADGIQWVGNLMIGGSGAQGFFVKDGTYTNVEFSDNQIVNHPNVGSDFANPVQVYPVTADNTKPLYTGFGVKMDHNTVWGNGNISFFRDCTGSPYEVQRNVLDGLTLSQDPSGSCANVATLITANQGNNVLNNAGNITANTGAGDTASSPTFVNADGTPSGDYELASSSPGFFGGLPNRAGITWNPGTKVFGPR